MHSQKELKDKCVEFLQENFADLNTMPNSHRLPNRLMGEIFQKILLFEAEPNELMCLAPKMRKLEE